MAFAPIRPFAAPAILWLQPLPLARTNNLGPGLAPGFARCHPDGYVAG
jgi:hypothetical protein